MLSPVTVGILGWLCFLIKNIYSARLVQKKLVLNKRDLRFISAGVLLFVTSFFVVYNTYNADYQMYEYIYSTYSSSIFNGRTPIFEVICYFGNLIGLDYQTFLSVVLLFSLFSMFLFIAKYSEEPALIFLMYMLSAAIMDGIQFRQFMATAVLMFVLPNILQENTKKGLIKYIIGVAISAGIHSSFVFCFVFALIKVEWRKRIKYAIVITILGLVGFVILQKSGLLIDVLSHIMSDEKIELYLVADKYHSSSGMVLSYIISQPVLLVAILFLIKKFGKYKPNNLPYINAVIGMDVLALVLCPIFFYSLQFRRVLRILFIPSFIAIEKLAPRKCGQMFYIARIAMLIFSLISLYWNLYSNPELLDNLFSNNYFY